MTGDVQNGLHYCFPDFRVEVIQLSGVIPWHRGTVIAVIDIAGVTGAVVDALEDYSCVLLGEVMVFDADADVRVRRKVAAVETISRVWAIIQGKETVRMVEHPIGINSHMIWDHIRCHADAVLPGTVFQVLEGIFTTQVIRDAVVGQ